jgi:hypothetical protein
MSTAVGFYKRQSIQSYRIDTLEKMYLEGRLKLREINNLQVRQIRRYILENAREEKIYFPPIVAYKKEGDVSDTLYVIDGNQRVKAFTQLYEFAFNKLGSDDQKEEENATSLLDLIRNTEIAIQVFEGLSEKEADQMYVDFNTKGKKVALSKRIAFDSRSQINQITNKVLQQNTVLQQAGIEMEKRAVIRPANKKFLSLSQLRQIVTVFLTGKMTVDQNKSIELSMETEQYLELIRTWLHELFDLYPAESIGDYEDSMLASFPLVMAVVLYALSDTEEMSFEEKKSTIITRMKRLKGVNWSRHNPVWTEFEGSMRGAYKYFYLNNNKKNIEKMAEWLNQQGG